MASRWDCVLLAVPLILLSKAMLATVLFYSISLCFVRRWSLSISQKTFTLRQGVSLSRLLADEHITSVHKKGKQVAARERSPVAGKLRPQGSNGANGDRSMRAGF